MPSKRKSDRIELPTPKRARFIEHYKVNQGEKSLSQIAREVDVKRDTARNLVSQFEQYRAEAAARRPRRFIEGLGRPYTLIEANLDRLNDLANLVNDHDYPAQLDFLNLLDVSTRTVQ